MSTSSHSIHPSCVSTKHRRNATVDHPRCGLGFPSPSERTADRSKASAASIFAPPYLRCHPGPCRPGGASVRQVPHRESSHEGGRPGAPRRDPRERPCAEGADAQDAVHLAEESLESHRAAAPSSERTAAPQSQDQSGVSPEGNLRAFLGLPPRRVGQAVPDALVLVGYALTPAAPARLCLDAAPPRTRHPQLLPHAHR